MKVIILLLVLLSLCCLTACSQSSRQQQNKPDDATQHIGGACEGCEAIYELAPPFDQLPSVDTLPDFNEPGPKIQISGIVYQRDGKTPAKDVVIYVYHTDQSGHYSTKQMQTGWAKRHGDIRGWMKTDLNGYYQFFTLRPAHYPGRNEPEHIHITLKEPDKNEYWLSEYMFEDDPLLSPDKRKMQEQRGGDGIIKLLSSVSGIAYGTRHIILGLNIPDYPIGGLPNIKSGLDIGDNCPAFEPLHLCGIDKGKHTCPMCKYGAGQGVMAWFNHTNLDQLKDFMQRLEQEMDKRRAANFRVYMVYMNPGLNENVAGGKKILKHKIMDWCQTQRISRVAMVWVPSALDSKTCTIYKINPAAKNTVFIYKKRTILNKWVNIEYSDEVINKMLKNPYDTVL